MGLFDVVTKPFEAAVDAGSAVVDKVADAGSAVVDTVTDAGSAAVDAGKEAVEDVVGSDGWAGAFWRLNPVTGPVLQAVDGAQAIKDVVTGEPGASIWDVPALGFLKGAGEGAVDLVKGLGYLGWEGIKSNPVRALWDSDGYAEQWQKNFDTAKYIVTNPDEVIGAITAPIFEDVEEGRPYEAGGRVAFEVLAAIFGPKGANKGVDAAADAGRVADAAADAGRVADAAADAGRVADDAGRVADDAGRVADDAGRVADDAAVAADEVEQLVPGLTPDEAAAASRIDLKHLFEGDETGGFHHAPTGPGQYGDVTVTPVHGTPKPGRTWKAEVTIDGVTKESTMFPSEWSRQDVVRAILEAQENGARTAGRDGATVVIGESRGLKIRIIEAPDGSIISAFPKDAGKAFT